MADLLDIEGGRSHKVGVFYEATQFLGSGRFADVYKAFDSNTQTDVVLKIYRLADKATHELAGAEARTLQEVETLNTDFFPKLRGSLKTRLHNQNHPLLVMELGQYVDENAQKSIVRLQDVMPPFSAGGHREQLSTFWSIQHLSHWILDLATAVKALHSRGIVHRDLKPANILLKRPAGAERPLPFIIDFNTSVREDCEGVSYGTERYLPPEVKARARSSPSEADDLWAIATLIWELIYGLGCRVNADAVPHSMFPDILLGEMREVLKRALQPDPAARFQTADECCKAIEHALAPSQRVDFALSVDQLSWARESADRIRNRIVDDLAGTDELPVPKDVRERVASLYIYLTEDQTRSADLKGEIIRLGARAIPALIEESYKIPPDTDDVRTIAEAIATLSQHDAALADRCLERLAVSSVMSVRAMCRTICQHRRDVPTRLVDLLLEDNGLLLPAERVALADVCIDCATDKHAILVLTKYMCREYVIDQNRYHDLRDRIARRMGGMLFAQKARLVLEDTVQRIWRDLDEFKALTPEDQQTCERGMLQLMGDAFASMAGEAFELMKFNLEQCLADDFLRRVWKVFCKKLCDTHDGARVWTTQLARRHTANRRLLAVIGRAVEGRTGERGNSDCESISEVFERYIAHGERRDFDILRFSQDRRVFDVLTARIAADGSTDTLLRVLTLLEGFESRCRPQVVQVLLNNWAQLTAVNYRKSVDVLTRFKLTRGPLYQQAISILNHDLKGSHLSDARVGLERLLG